MSEATAEIVLERMYCLRVGDHTLALAEPEARKLYDLLRAEFSGIQLGVLIQLLGQGSSDPVQTPVHESGPTLNDDIANAIAKHVVESQEKVDGAERDSSEDHFCPNCKNERCAGLGCKDIEPGDDADEQEAEFLSRLPVCGSPSGSAQRFTGRVVAEVEFHQDGGVTITDVPSNTPEPPAEPEKAPETPSPSNEHQVAPANSKTWQDRLLELWARYSEGRSASAALGIIYTSTRSSKFSELKNMDTAGLREALRSLGVDVPDPMTPQERASRSRAVRLARAGERLEPPKVQAAPAPEPIEEAIAPMPIANFAPEATIQLIHVLTRSVRRRWPEDREVIMTHIADMGPLTPLRQVTAPMIEKFDTQHQAWLDAYSAMPPYKQREIDSSLLAEWKRVAA